MKTKLVWLVTEIDGYGKVRGRRRFLELGEALRTAGVWVSQSAGAVTIARREVEV